KTNRRTEPAGGRAGGQGRGGRPRGGLGAHHRSRRARGRVPGGYQAEDHPGPGLGRGGPPQGLPRRLDRRSAVMAKGKLAIGLDIGSTSVKMIQLKETRRRGEVIYSLQNFGMKPLPPEAIVDNALMNSTAIVQAIQEL